MALRCRSLVRLIRSTNLFRHNAFSSSVSVESEKSNRRKEFRTEDNLVYYGDPDKFGTLSPRIHTDKVILEDEGDIREEKLISEIPISSQKLTTRQYADLIKQYLSQKRLKDALNILEVRMLQEDRVKPENYIYNILIGACAEVGYTKKAFKLFNEMKRRDLKPTGDTYTCLFHACSNSPWPVDGLKNATHLREFMIERGIEPNLTNYNAMIKAFGRCGDLPTAFKIVDEMIARGIKIRVHTLNHLLHACISDKTTGLRHALVVWRKMLKLREKPNIYTFNLMLKCVKECNLGSRTDIEELIGTIQEQIALNTVNKKPLRIESSKRSIEAKKQINEDIINNEPNIHVLESKIECTTNTNQKNSNDNGKEILAFDNISMQIVNKETKTDKDERTVPNLLSRTLQMDQVLALQPVTTLQDKFAVIGGQEDFLKEMNVYSVKPDVKTFTQMLPLLEDSTEAENRLLDTMKDLDSRPDIDFYNMLIKKRCLRSDYDAAFDVMKIIKKEDRIRKKRFPDRKRLHLKPNIMTYGVLAMACKTKENAESFLNDMKEAQVKVNIEILGTLLRQGTANNNFGYVLYIMNMVKELNITPNAIFLKHLETFNEKCSQKIEDNQAANQKISEVYLKTYRIFSKSYRIWLKEIDFEEILKPEHPWTQFSETYPDTLQKQNVVIKQPKKFYKRNRKYIKYVPTV